jgi:dipicolinate synthase subunit A
LNIAVCGGGDSAARLCALFAADGHSVRAYALDEADLAPGVVRTGCPEGCMDGARAVILPIPAADEAGRLNAPLCRRAVSAEELVIKAPEGALICVGGAENLPDCRYMEDYSAREEFAVGYAALAAEGALELAMAAGDGAILGSNSLVLGYGRLGKILCGRLIGLGARVTAAARRPGELAEAKAMGLCTADISGLDGRLGEFDYIFNTVPAPVISGKRLAEIRAGAFMAELASRPGGFDVHRAEEMGIVAISAPDLPARCAPQAAAELIRDAVYAAMDEWEL